MILYIYNRVIFFKAAKDRRAEYRDKPKTKKI